jgi:recombination DNA repair RAD52 pathway protein
LQCKFTRNKDDREEVDLPAAKSIALVNHYLGFDGWSSEIVTLRVDAIEMTPAGVWTCACSAIVRLQFKGTASILLV